MTWSIYISGIERQDADAGNWQIGTASVTYVEGNFTASKSLNGPASIDTTYETALQFLLAARDGHNQASGDTQEQASEQ